MLGKPRYSVAADPPASMLISAPRLQYPTRQTHPETARVLLFSMRNIERHVSRCGGYEFEEVICSCDEADMVAPFPDRPRGNSRIARRISRLLSESGWPIGREMRVSTEYDLFFAFCLSPRDLRYLKRLNGVHHRCRRSVCVIGELWPSRMSEFSKHLQVLRGFDQIFSNLQSSVDLIAQSTGRPCRFLPLGIDALRFCPFPENPTRNIDVFNMGRRVEDEHRALLASAESGEIFYVYDTVADFEVINPREHRLLLANLIKRSRYFFVHPAKHGVLGETRGAQEIGSRFFEGAAGGAVMIGTPPRCAAFNDCFAWRDAVMPVAGERDQITALVAELETQPQRVAQIRESNVIHSLQRHDWVYRWREILECVDLPATTKLVEREEQLNRMAKGVRNAEHVAVGSSARGADVLTRLSGGALDERP
jgi:Glycosyl transferases group 1